MSSKKPDSEFFIPRYPCTLASLRRYNKHTQSDLAKLLGVSKNAVSAWETNQSFMRVDHLFDICNEYNVDPRAVYCFDPDYGVPAEDRFDPASDTQLSFQDRYWFPSLEPLFGPDDDLIPDDLPY